MIVEGWRRGARRVVSLGIRAMRPFIFLLLVFIPATLGEGTRKDWSNSGYPDVRGPTHELCAAKLPKQGLLYICDPDRILNATQREFRITEVIPQIFKLQQSFPRYRTK